MFYALGIFGLGLLLISFFVKGVLIHCALLAVWIAEILQANSTIAEGDIKTWLMIALACLMMYSVVMMFKKFISTGGVD